MSFGQVGVVVQVVERSPLPRVFVYRCDVAFAAIFSGTLTIGSDSAASFSACSRKSFSSGLSMPSWKPDFSATPLGWTHGQLVRLAWSLDGLPALLGDGDDPGSFVAHHPLVDLDLGEVQGDVFRQPILAAVRSRRRG